MSKDGLPAGTKGDPDGSYGLPPNLPVPTDDGACRHLPGRTVPSVILRSSRGGRVDVADLARSTAVFFFYPAATGRPDAPPEWDQIPGARGCTQQNCAYRDRYARFQENGAGLYGVSVQPSEEQAAFAERLGIPYPLLSDADFELTRRLDLPTFAFRGQRYIKRLTLLVERGRIEEVFYPVFPPQQDAEAVLDRLKLRRSVARGVALELRNDPPLHRRHRHPDGGRVLGRASGLQRGAVRSRSRRGSGRNTRRTNRGGGERRARPAESA